MRSIRLASMMRFRHSMTNRPFLLLILLALVAFRALALDIPTAVEQGFRSTEAGVVGRSIINAPTPTETPSIKPLQVPPSEMPKLNPKIANYKFVLRGVRLKGNTVYSTNELEAIFKPHLQHTITIGELFALVQAITDKYQHDGYFLSKAFLPPQEIIKGIITIQIVEGRISTIKLQGIKQKRMRAFIKRYDDRVITNRPIQLATLERYLLLLNDVPGLTVKSVIEPDPKTPLGSTLTLVSTMTPLNLTLTQDNYQTPYLGPKESAAFGTINSFFIPGGTFYARALTADQQHKLSYYEVKHDQFLGTDGLQLTFDGYSTKTQPQFVLAPLEIVGTSADANVALSYPLIRSRERNLTVLAQFDYMNNASDALGQQLYYDLIRNGRLAGTYTDTLWKGNDTAFIAFDKGFSSLGHNPHHSRTNAHGDYLKISGTISRTQYVGNSPLSLYALVTAQYTNHILPSAETLTFGGPYLGRGYDWSQFTGDQGIAGKGEARLSFNPNLPFLKQIQLYSFYDVGTLSSLIPLVIPVSAASAGVGLRAALMNHLNAEGFVGRPLTAPNASQVVAGNSGHAFLGFFQLTAYL